jgi:hypothetical protein
MMTLLRMIVLGCFVLASAPPSASQGGSGEFATSFCPECWKFLKAKDASCSRGTCLTCGKEAIAVDAEVLTWTWCSDHEWWHQRPCPLGRARGNGRLRTAMALVVSRGDKRLDSSAYCPECRLLPDPLKMERGRCPSCQGPLVPVTVVEPKWFWCARDLHWKVDPCPQNGLHHCCVARRGTLLAKPRSVQASSGSVPISSRFEVQGKEP